jgi:hypothetical protein
VSIQAQIDALENLSALDQDLDKLEAELSEEREALGGKREQLQQFEAKLRGIRAGVTEMERTRNDLLTEARQMSLQMERSREKLARSRTEREVNAAQREVEELRKLFRDREIETQKLAGLIEQAQTDQEATVAQRDALAAALGSSEGATETRLGQLERASATRRESRESAAKAVSPTLYRRYQAIRKRKGDPICHTIKGTCSACHISLAPMMYQVLRRGEAFDQCPSCSRIMYFRDDEAEPADTEPGSDS